MSLALESKLEALLFLSPEPVDAESLADATGAELHEVVSSLERLREHYDFERRGLVLRELAGGWALSTHPDAEPAARRLLARPRTPTLTPAQAETLAIIAYLQPVSRPEIARIRGVNAESAAATLLERGLIEEAGRSQFGAVLYRTTELFLRAVRSALARRAPGHQLVRSGAGARGGAARAAAPGRRGPRRRLQPSPRPAGRELAARRVDLAPAGEPYGRVEAAPLELLPERRDRLRARAGVDRSGRVVRDQVDLEHARVEDLGQLHRLRVRVVDAGEHHVLDEHLAALAGVMRLARRDHVGERVALVDRHQLGAERLVGGVERQREPDRHRVRGQALDPGDPADRRDRGAAMPDPDVGQPLARREHVVEVHHRLAHPHEHRVIRAPPALEPAEVQRLVEDLGRGEVAAEAHLPGGAERAGQRAAGLRGQADRPAPVAVAHQYRFDRPAVAGAEQRLDRPVGGVRLALDREAGERDRLGERVAQAEWKVGHVGEGARPARRPSPHLAGAVPGLPEFVEPRCEQIEIHADYGGRPHRQFDQGAAVRRRRQFLRRRRRF